MFYWSESFELNNFILTYAKSNLLQLGLEETSWLPAKTVKLKTKLNYVNSNGRALVFIIVMLVHYQPINNYIKDTDILI